MTEAEWLACTDAQMMLKSLRRKSSERKLRHFACACCRDIWHLLTDEHSRIAVEVAERFADGDATRDELDAALKEASAVAGPPAWAAAWTSEGQARKAARNAARGAVRAVEWGATVRAAEGIAVKAGQAAALREVFGNPFRSVAIHPGWRTPTVTNLATAAYEERALPSGELDAVRLAVLADALEEATCDNGDILNHLRAPGPHVRGCWVIDLLLAKE